MSFEPSLFTDKPHKTYVKKLDKRYVTLIEDLCWLKNDISGLVRLRCYDVARYQLKCLRRLAFLKSYIENLGFFPDWYESVRREY